MYLTYFERRNNPLRGKRSARFDYMPVLRKKEMHPLKTRSCTSSALRLRVLILLCLSKKQFVHLYKRTPTDLRPRQTTFVFEMNSLKLIESRFLKSIWGMSSHKRLGCIQEFFPKKTPLTDLKNLTRSNKVRRG